MKIINTKIVKLQSGKSFRAEKLLENIRENNQRARERQIKQQTELQLLKKSEKIYSDFLSTGTDGGKKIEGLKKIREHECNCKKNEVFIDSAISKISKKLTKAC